ncbi:hypothetical protein QQZ08_001198 [Neonectria magnoliae]|uniref:ATPase AAA-type core domain-containing protein n=1 Tax=Neonectria magnoliae TaxID=2732573 RepID=A0ABR1IF44_9HYPO
MLDDLFNKLPPRCVVLLEDIDTAAATHCRGPGTENASERAKHAGDKSVTLSGLLNAFDGVASQEGRLLIMTTNHIKKLDEALIRPGRIDREVEFQLVNRNLATQIYRLVFEEPDEVGSSGEKRAKDQPMIGQLAVEFAAKVPDHEFSPAEVLTFLIQMVLTALLREENPEQLDAEEPFPCSWRSLHKGRQVEAPADRDGHRLDAPMEIPSSALAQASYTRKTANAKPKALCNAVYLNGNCP